MHTVSLCDKVELMTNKSGMVTLECPALSIPQEKNIARKAAHLYLERAGITDGVHIAIEKRIPWEAGLGGGSSDAGAVLRGLNLIYKYFDTDSLCSIAAEIGSDVPFCVRGGCMLARGRGEILTELPVLPECYIVIAKGGAGSSTAKAYEAADKNGFTPKINTLDKPLKNRDLVQICNNTFNRFEDTALYAHQIKDIMFKCGALTSLLSGSGSAVFGIFNDREKAGDAADKLGKLGYWSSVSVPIDSFTV